MTLPIVSERLVRSQWLLNARAEREAGAELLALWGSDERDRGGGYLVRAAFLRGQSVRILALAVPADAPSLPSLAEVFPAAGRMERALYDLLGVRADGGDARPWLRHASWPEDFFPLRRDADGTRQFPAAPEHYPFVRVEGDGVHEIPVGPVHAGIIEPGHFRFSVVGEKLLRLEQRL
ncbi:MAG: NADH-quinone oxidoreductase subunit C, partial [Gammaproteobacteria bacterium]|nr:NADH-quinone oxidoreductase subunit C [Gammaproteobacteria bacterium]